MDFGLTLSGGGVKGFAFIGVFKAGEERRIKWANMAGVSVGAIAIAINAAGYDYIQFLNLIDTLDLKSLRINEAANLPVIKRYRDLQTRGNSAKEVALFRLLEQSSEKMRSNIGEVDQRGVLKDIVNFSSERALFDGDYLEEWIYDALARKGIRTFSDLKGGIIDKKNPRGYKVRMTCVDCTRFKTVVLPDDLTYYDINPDDFEVAKAVRASASIPFAFKPVIIKKDGVNHYLIDGGVFDNFPFWLIDNSITPAVGFRLISKNKGFSLETPIDILKSIIASVYDMGIPHHSKLDIDYVEDIYVPDVSTLDFDLSDEAKSELIEAGYDSANNLFNKIKPRTLTDILRNLFR